MVVLIDCGCRVGGYTSDITRTIWFGDSPSDEFRKVFNVVHDARPPRWTWGARARRARRWTAPRAR